ncbi:MAG TPA: DUF4365 domain-containing protein [Candidatus Bathyarchaeia archaeon]|nr:DUF4365 domain-containing protein [Candidatus Bathyarchaeia archaeon]
MSKKKYREKPQRKIIKNFHGLNPIQPKNLKKIRTAKKLQIPKFARLGRSGQLEIASILSSFANYAQPEYDVGIDFFCELLDDGCPSGIFFWVQAKTSDKFEESWSEYIDKETVRLWLEQPFPVYIIVCEKASGSFYWASVEDNRENWQSMLLTKSKTINVVVSRSNVLEKDPNNNSEFKRKIRGDTIRLNAIKGIPMFVKQGYGSPAFGYVPALRLSDVARENIRGTIRFGFDYLVIDEALRNQFENAYKLCKLLSEFDKCHYDHFLMFARICRQLGKSAEAKTTYETAIRICKGDRNWDKDRPQNIAPMSVIIHAIEEEMATVS